eukprot:COSAG06_NODE_16585_length_992_cov_1.513998_1_plen_86_part_00
MASINVADLTGVAAKLAINARLFIHVRARSPGRLHRIYRYLDVPKVPGSSRGPDGQRGAREDETHTFNTQNRTAISVSAFSVLHA